ncbi:MAG TPA: type II toxin-antitoxin system ParD family antitoxin [Armatimonadota bacterium]|jgi:hypothetical protein
MASLTVELEDTAREFAEGQAKARGYSDVGQYIAYLVAEAMEREVSPELEALLVEGLESGPRIEAGPEFWDALRAEAGLVVRESSR